MDTLHPQQTLFQKIWSRHRIMERDDGKVLLYVDKHWVHDVTAAIFAMLRQRDVAVHMPSRTYASPDHFIPTVSRNLADTADPEKRSMVQALERDAAGAGIPIFGLNDPRQGIMHVLGPEQGLSLPGETVVCGDSHTSTHGALGALAFGIGATEVAHVLATQSIWQHPPKTMRISVNGTLGESVTAKDVILAIIARIGAAGAVGHVIEYAGSTIETLSMEGRLTLCNMSIEAGARAGMVAPDETTFAYVKGRPYAPTGEAWERAVAKWRTLATDPGARFDREVTLDAAEIQPMATWGTSPENALPITGRVPDPAKIAEPEKRAACERMLDYMGLVPGTRLTDIPVDRVFIGSCTNGRIEDLRSAASVVQGRQVADGVEAWVVPGSGLVRAQAEAEGLDRIFKSAGFQWRYAGCSMCLTTNGDMAAPGQRCASTTNRNFVGRQGPGVRTHLVSPSMAAAAAVTGRLTDVRTLTGKVK
jgi:3-isopropylmalate/(R)-2-methylmalate dehydratase large subunit